MCKAPECEVAADAPQSSEDEAQLEQRIAQALECPCIDDLKAGPCGELFVSTFTCYHRSRAEPKGCDCLDVSLAFADCLRRHPELLDAVQGAKDASELALGAPPSPASSTRSSSRG